MNTAASLGAAAFVAGAGLAVEAGQKLQESQDGLEQAVKHTGGSYEELAPQLDATRAKMEKLGFTNDEVNTSIAKLTLATGDSKTAISLESTAADLARARHISLADATTMLAKASGGSNKGLKDLNVTMASGATWAKATASANQMLADQIKSAGGMANFASQHHLSLAQATKLVKDAANGSVPALNKLGIDVLPKSATAAQRMAELTTIMNGKIGGDASAAADTAEGKFAVLKAQFTDTAAKVGEKLLPVITKMLGFISEHIGAVLLFAGAIGALMIAAKVGEAIKTLSEAFKIMDIAMSASTIGLIIIAVVALGVGIYLLVTHWKQAWSDIKKWAADAWNFIHDGWAKWLILPMYLLISTIIWVVKNWKQIFGDLKNWIWNDFLLKIYGFFVKTLPSWWDISFNFVKTKFIQPVQTAYTNLKNWIWNDFLLKIYNFFLKTLPSWWDAAVNLVKTRFVQPWQNILVSGWNWIVNNVWNPIKTFITRTVPGWWDTGVKAIAGFWNKIGNIVKVPVNFLIGTVYDNGIRRFWNDIVSKIPGIPDLPMVPKLARGGRLPGFGGGDVLPILAEPGEAVVDKYRTRKFAHVLSAMGVPGFQHGGAVGQHPPSPQSQTPSGAGSRFGPIPGVGGVTGDLRHYAGKAWDLGKIAAGVLTGNTTAAANALNDFIGVPKGLTGGIAAMMLDIPKRIVKGLVGLLTGAGMGASGNSIADYAMSFLGKLPYVWGGTSLATGADCSGFVQAIYRHFGISAPRTSEAQGAWVRRSGPQPGGLAFYHSPPGGPDPGHVAIVRDLNHVISQGGGMGPQLMGINAMPLLWTGVPPSGLGGATGGSTPGRMTASAIASLWTSLGGPGWAAGNMARIASAESGNDPSIIQQGQPPGLTGWGLYQITPTSGISQNGIFGNLLNAANNTRAAISLFSRGGYASWMADPVGRALTRFGAHASGGIGGGWAVVGEHGRELVRLQQGSYVRPTAAQAAPMGGPGKLEIEWIGGNASDEFIRWLRKNIRVRGGDVQAVLGWN